MRKPARYVFSIGAAAAFLAGCGALRQGQDDTQQPIAAPGALPFSTHAQNTPARNAARLKGRVEFVYVANLGSDNVSAYAVDVHTGGLTQIQGSPFAAGYGPYAAAVDPSGFLYVGNNGANTKYHIGSVSGFAVSPQSGALTPVPGSPFMASRAPIAVAISPSGKFVYVINFGFRNFSVFAVNSATGTLKPIKGYYQTRPDPLAEAMDPNGKFLYVIHGTYPQGHIEGFAVDPRDGALTKLKGAEFATGSNPDGAAIDPSGRFLYVSSYDSEYVYAYAIAAGTGALSAVTGAPFRAGQNPGAVAVDPRGTFVYVPADQQVYGYTIETDGALTEVPGSPFAGGNGPDAIAIDPLGKFVYVSSSDRYAEGVYAYTIDPSNGALTQVPGSPFPAGSYPAGIATCEVEGDHCVPAIP